MWWCRGARWAKTPRTPTKMLFSFDGDQGFFEITSIVLTDINTWNIVGFWFMKRIKPLWRANKNESIKRKCATISTDRNIASVTKKILFLLTKFCWSVSKDFTCVNPTNVQDIRLHFKSLLVVTKAVTKYSCAKFAKHFPALTAIKKTTTVYRQQIHKFEQNTKKNSQLLI